MLFSTDFLSSQMSGTSLSISYKTSRSHLRSNMKHCFYFLKHSQWNSLAVPYLSKSEHLSWSVLEDHSDLGQVGGVLPEQTSLMQLSCKLLTCVLHLVAWRVRSHTEQSYHNVTECRCGPDVLSSGYKWCWDNRTLEGVHCSLMRTFSWADEPLLLEVEPLITVMIHFMVWIHYLYIT